MGDAIALKLALPGINRGDPTISPGGFEISYDDQLLRVHGGDGLGLSALLAHDPATGRTVAILVNDETVRSLGFGKPGYLDAFALELLSR